MASSFRRGFPFAALLMLLGFLDSGVQPAGAQFVGPATGNQVVNANTANYVQGSVSFQDSSVLNANVTAAVSGNFGIPTFQNSSILNAEAVDAISSEVYISFTGNSTLNADVTNSIAAQTRTFNGSSVFNANVAHVADGGYTYLYGSSTYNANVADAASGDTIWISSASGAVILVKATNALGDAAIYFQAGGPGGSFLRLDGHSTTSGLITSDSGIGIIENASATAATLTMDSDSAGTYSGLIRDGTGGGALSLVKAGTGTWTLGGANTYTGGTTIQAGTLALDNGASLAATGAVAVASGATFDISAAGVNQTIGDLAGAGVVNLGGNSLTTGTANDSAFSGNIIGSGGLVKQGSGTLVLSGINFYTGGTTIQGGTIEIQRAQALGTSASGTPVLTFDGSGATLRFDGDFTLNHTIVLASDGTIDTNGNDVTLLGTIQGPGGLVKTGTGTLALTGNNSYVGGTTLRAGTLQVGGPLALGSGALTFDGGGTVLQFGASTALFNAVVLNSDGVIDSAGNNGLVTGSVTGSGGLTVTDSSGTSLGNVTLASLNIYSGATRVESGTLSVTGSIQGSSGVEVGSGATLNVAGSLGVTVGVFGAGTAGTLTVNSGGAFGGGGTLVGDAVVNGGGVLAPGGSQTTHIAGNLALNGGSRTEIAVASSTDYGRIAVTGTAALGGTLVVDPAGGYAPRPGDRLTFLTAGSVTGTFDAVQNGLGNAVGYVLAYDPGAVAFTLTAVQDPFLPFAANPNQAALARTLDRVAADPREAALVNALNSLPGTSLPAAFQQIVPVQQATVAQSSVQASHAAFNTLWGRMDNIRSGSTGLSMSQFNWLDQNIPGSALIAGTAIPTGIKAFQPEPDNRWGFFAAADGNFGDIDGQTVQSNYHGAGFTVGSDYRLDQAFAVGFALGYDYSKTDFDHSGSNSEANTVRFGPYATWHDRAGNWVDGTASGAVHFYDSNRQGFGGMAASDTTGAEFDGSVKYGHDFHAGPWTLTPTFGLDYLHLDIGKYTESGSLAPLTVQEQTVDSFRSDLGGQVGYGFRWKGVAWNPYVQAGWAHEFLDASQSVSARFASGAGDVFATTGDNLGHDSATFGAGLQAGLTEAVTANLSYAGEANDRYQDHSFNAAVRVQF